MPALTFPLLSDLIREVQAKVDQPESDPAGLTWPLGEFVQACNQEQDYLFRRLGALDKDFNIKVDTTLSVTSGSRTLALPADCAALRRVHEITSAGAEVDNGQIAVAKWDELGSDERSAIYLPKQNVLHFTVVPTRTYPVKIVYEYEPVPLVHGVVRTATATTIQLATHESGDDSLYVGLVISAFASGVALQALTVSTYAGSSRTATMSGSWTTTPTTATTYTSRPDLPRSARDAFVYGVCARLVEKNQDERFMEFTRQREAHMSHLAGFAGMADRQAPLTLRDDYYDGGYADPFDLGIVG